jgi:hypothetical protein
MAGCASTPLEESNTLYFSPDTVEIRGVISSATYLSVMEGSPKEMINKSYVIELEKPVTVARNPNSTDDQSGPYKNVQRVEIANIFDFNFEDVVGKKVVLSGTLSPIKEMRGFHRQISTPIRIYVTSIVLADE